ncbi:MAG: ROK family protein [Mucilaginibacter sp.]|uniref:ROK family protein n=1 Tax=Mucilaginibacter sp. TaxID=1882438 RepID=UPI0032646EA3
MNNINYVTCADIGGSHITTSIVDLNDQSVIRDTFSRKEVNAKGTWPDIRQAWVETMKLANTKGGFEVEKVALAMPGPFDYANGISYITGLDKYEAIYGLNIRELLAEELGIEPENVRFRNDAEATIAGEFFAGAGRGYANVMGVTLGTGFGSAQFASNYCRDLNLGSKAFNDTIADDYFSTRWFLKTYYEMTGMSLSNGVKELSEMKMDNIAKKMIFSEFGINMVDFLASPIDQLKPDILLLCGNIAKAAPFFLPYLRKHLNVPIELATLGEQAPLIGAAAVFQYEQIMRNS